MSHRRIIGTSGAVLALAGIAVLPAALVDGWQSIADIGGGLWWTVQAALAVHHLLVLLGLGGILNLQHRSAAVLSLAAFAIAMLGNSMALALRIVRISILPDMAANPDTESLPICTPFFPPATQSARSFIDQACEASPFSVLGTLETVAMLLLTIGTLVLGLSVIAASRLPALGGALLSLGGLGLLVAGIYPNLPAYIGDTGFSLVGTGYLWVGVNLFIRRGTP